VSRRLQRVQSEGLARYLQSVHGTADLRLDRGATTGGVLAIFHRWIYGAMVASIGSPEVALYFWDHPGGRIVVEAARRLGITAIPGGPSNRYGVRAVRRWLADDRHVLGVAVDGPLGPPQVVQPGAVRFARLARVPVHPVHVDMGNSFELPSWDRLRVPDCWSTLSLKVLPAVPRAGKEPAETRALAEALDAQSPSPPSASRLRDVPLRRFARMCLAHAPLGTITFGPASPARDIHAGQRTPG
jgi:lysophospholipid acyltransferase (LPLAT)-like uncharacterized protein